MVTLIAGEEVTDKVQRARVLVVEDRGDRVLVTSTKAAKPDAQLIDKAQWVVARSDLTTLPPSSFE